MKITEALLAEHVVFHSIFSSVHREMSSFGTVEEFKAVANMLLGTLEAHGKAEHDLLLPPIESYLNDIGHLENFHDEDEAIVDNLRAVSQAGTIKDAKLHLNRALRLAHEHFDKEERLVFPLAEKHISEESLHDLGEQWRHLKEL
jgi:hemerythrin-like domain-containing protein